MVGSSGVVAEIESAYSLFSDFTDLWRKEGDVFVRSGEGRFIDEVGYVATMEETIGQLMRQQGLRPQDFSRVVYYAPDARQHAELAKRLGFPQSQVQETYFDYLGNTGCAAAPIMLIAALRRQRPGTGFCSRATGTAAMLSCFA